MKLIEISSLKDITASRLKSIFEEKHDKKNSSKESNVIALSVLEKFEESKLKKNKNILSDLEKIEIMLHYLNSAFEKATFNNTDTVKNVFFPSSIDEKLKENESYLKSLENIISIIDFMNKNCFVFKYSIESNQKIVFSKNTIKFVFSEKYKDSFENHISLFKKSISYKDENKFNYECIKRYISIQIDYCKKRRVILNDSLNKLKNLCNNKEELEAIFDLIIC